MESAKDKVEQGEEVEDEFKGKSIGWRLRREHSMKKAEREEAESGEAEDLSSSDDDYAWAR